MSKHSTLNPAIHAAFRRDLVRFDRAFDAYQARNRPRAAQLTAAWGQFCHQLHLHHHDEEEYFWPAFRELGLDESILEPLEGEHEVMVTALDAAEQEMAEYASDPTGARAKTAQLAIADLRRVLGDHLAHEERVLDPFSTETAKSRPHRAAKKAARKAHTEGPGTFFSWLLDDADAESVRIIRREVPPPVLYLMTRIGGRDYRRDIASTWSG